MFSKTLPLSSRSSFGCPPWSTSPPFLSLIKNPS
jgi:hypothetical protein